MFCQVLCRSTPKIANRNIEQGSLPCFRTLTMLELNTILCHGWSTACQEKRTNVETARPTEQGAGGEKKTVWEGEGAIRRRPEKQWQEGSWTIRLVQQVTQVGVFNNNQNALKPGVQKRIRTDFCQKRELFHSPDVILSYFAVMHCNLKSSLAAII